MDTNKFQLSVNIATFLQLPQTLEAPDFMQEPSLDFFVANNTNHFR